MAVSRRTSIAGMGYVGYPALIFMELNLYGKAQNHEEKLTSLEKIYSYLRAYLPVQYREKGDPIKIEFYDGEIKLKIFAVFEKLKEATDRYQPAFEGLKSCSEEEKIFRGGLKGIFEDLNEIIAITHIIDKQAPDGQEFEV